MTLIEKECHISNYPALLNSRYTDVYNRPLAASARDTANTGRFPALHGLIATARQFFGRYQGVLSLVNTVILV